MPFRVRDLVINVVPEEAGARAALPTIAGCCPGITRCPQFTCFECTQDLTICRPCSADPTFNCGFCSFKATPICAGRCSFAITPICYRGTLACHAGTDCGLTCLISDVPVVETPEEIVTLKAELREALAAVEAQEQALKEKMAPQSVEEAEALEQKLTEALEELRAHKDNLRKTEGGG